MNTLHLFELGAGLVLIAAGYVSALFVVARDRQWTKVPDDCVVVKKVLMAKLQEIADVKTKNPRLKFDSRGILKTEGDDEES